MMPPVTDAQVEAASRAFGGTLHTHWEHAARWERESVRERMRGALEAARKVGLDET